MGWNSLKQTRTAKLRLTVTFQAEGKGRMDPAALQFCHRRGSPWLSSGAGDLKYPPRPTHPVGRPLLAGPGAPARRRLLGPRVHTETRGERCVSQRRPKRGSDSAGAPHPSSAAVPPLPGEGKRGRWLKPPPRGQVPLMLQHCARAAPPPSSPPPPPAQPLARPPPPQSRATRHQLQTAGSLTEKQ